MSFQSIEQFLKQYHNHNVYIVQTNQTPSSNYLYLDQITEEHNVLKMLEYVKEIQDKFPMLYFREVCKEGSYLYIVAVPLNTVSAIITDFSHGVDCNYVTIQLSNYIDLGRRFYVNDSKTNVRSYRLGINIKIQIESETVNVTTFTYDEKNKLMRLEVPKKHLI